ncbi:hypothetical protein B2J93_3262 [Marssonina coronariae]|uniref:Uncharacterized protein n=1 Tax=Diplocarpon coronariae TaxID=2795749 RepID=A0A218Z6D3_9HELO|nr:hypothetical protein B2J93_3262 [Marssonina coronariae]
MSAALCSGCKPPVPPPPPPPAAAPPSINLAACGDQTQTPARIPGNRRSSQGLDLGPGAFITRGRVMSRTSLVVAGEAAVDLRRAGRDESSQGRGDAALCGWWPLPAAAGRSGRAPIPKTRNLVSGLPARGALRPVGIYLSLAMLCNDADRISTNDGFGLRTRGSGNLVQPRTAFPAPPQSHGRSATRWFTARHRLRPRGKRRSRPRAGLDSPARRHRRRRADAAIHALHRPARGQGDRQAESHRPRTDAVSRVGNKQDYCTRRL